MKRSLLHNTFGISVMYDAVLFMVMVSLAGVVLLPALRSNIAVQTSVEKHREFLADEALHTFLVSKADIFYYRFGGHLLDTIAQAIGIDNTSQGLYESITRWFLGHEQCHKTYAALLAENLGCQFQLPLPFLGFDRFNLFTSEYDDHLRNEITQFFSAYLGDKYCYNFTAWWHPIRGVSFGGELQIGDRPPTKDCYVSHGTIIMPFTPKITIANHTVVFTKQWLKNTLFDGGENGTDNSSIPAITNIIRILDHYMKGLPPFETRNNATRATEENLSALIYGFLVDGIQNKSQETVFPGIVNITITSGFEKIKNIIKGFTEEAVNDLFGEAVQAIDRVFEGLSPSVDTPLAHLVTEEINGTLQSLLNTSYDSFDEVVQRFKKVINENVTNILKNFLTPSIKQFVEILFDVIDTLHKFADLFLDWLFELISLNTAEVTLTIWVVRE